MTHPAYQDVDVPWDTLIAAYAERMADPSAPQRIAAYFTIMSVWWVVRWARTLYEVPRGLDPRLVARPINWQIHAQQQFNRALAQATALL